MIEVAFFLLGVLALAGLFALGSTYAERARRNDYCRGASKK